MKIFTKSVMVAIALMAGVTTANAQEEDWTDPDTWEEVTAEMWAEYSSADGIHWDPSLECWCRGWSRCPSYWC